MIKIFYHQNLPHIHPVGATFFVTFRLQGSLPHGFIKKIKMEYETKILEIETTPLLNPEVEIYKAQKMFFKKYDTALDLVFGGVDYLKNPKVAQVVADKMHQYDGKLYELLSYCIMPNHVHMVFDTALQIQGMDIHDVNENNYTQVDKIMGLIKGASSFEVNKILELDGKFWQKESYDHYARTGKELVNIIWYVLKNPVKAGFVKSWDDYKFTFLKDSSGLL